MVPFITKYQKVILLTVVLSRLVSTGFAQCPEFDPGYSTGTIQSPDVDEASGLAASRKNPYVLWTQKDKGDSARIFAMKMDGTHLGIYYLSGAINRDWEDIAVGPGPVDGKFLKIGPPWPDHIKSESGGLPKYVVYGNGKWVAYTEKMLKEYYSTKKEYNIRRARIDIELVVDGDIVDLNRIPLPPDTPIIDKRFKDSHTDPMF